MNKWYEAEQQKHIDYVSRHGYSVCGRCGKQYVPAEADEALWTCPKCQLKYYYEELALFRKDREFQLSTEELQQSCKRVRNLYMY